MSATIHYRVLSEKEPYLAVDAPSSFISAMERAFGSLPCIVNRSSIPTLRGMYAVSGEGGYEALIDVIEKVGAVQLYATY